jgi:hypothetical protein
MVTCWPKNGGAGLGCGGCRKSIGGGGLVRRAFRGPLPPCGWACTKGGQSGDGGALGGTAKRRAGLHVSSLVHARRSLSLPPDCESASKEALQPSWENVLMAAWQSGVQEGTRPHDGRSSSDRPHCRTRWVNCFMQRNPVSSAEHACRASAICTAVSVCPKAPGAHEVPSTEALNCCTAAWQAKEHWKGAEDMGGAGAAGMSGGGPKQAAANSTASGAWSLHPPRQTVSMDSR